MKLQERIEVPVTTKDVDGKAWEMQRIVYVLERTCRLEKARWDNGECTWGVICSACGDKHEHETGICWKYCPSCGAKVVSE